MSDVLALADFRTLLSLQELDSTIDQLRLRRENTPGHEALKSVQHDAVALRPELVAAQGARDALLQRQTEVDDEVATTRKRIDEINSRLYDGSARLAPNDALAMSHEVKHLQERQRQLEDSELELMEQLEAAEAAVAPLEAKGVALSQQLQSAQFDITTAQTQIDAELTGLVEMRGATVAQVPQSLVDHYEMLRSKLSGVAVAALSGNTCGGCHLTMAATELAELRAAPESALLHCEECGRLLVRTN